MNKIIVLLFILFILIIFLNKYNIKDNFSLYKQLIKDNEIKNDLEINNSNILLGNNASKNYITYKTQFNFYLTKTYYNKRKLSIDNYYPKYKDIYYLNNGISCPKQSSTVGCFDKNSKNITECVFLSNKENPVDVDVDINSNYNLDNLDFTGLWSFYNISRKNDDVIYYGDEVAIKNVGTNMGFICMCELGGVVNGLKCGNIVDIFCYDDFRDVNKDGKWIIIPSYANNNDLYYHNNSSDLTDKKDKQLEKDPLLNIKRTNNLIDYDFYETHENDNYDLERLKNQKIPIKTTDSFLIINSRKINDKYVYLNICLDNVYLESSFRLTCDGNQNIKDGNNDGTLRIKASGSSPMNTQLANFKEKDVIIYNWNINPVLYDTNVKDTLFVKGSIFLNDMEITSKTLEYIKQIPYHFDKEICLRDAEKGYTKCIDKSHVEMLNGSRSINVKSVVPLKPFILYSKSNYDGRELRIGFNYDKANNLPYLKRTEFMNVQNNGKWLSLKIDYDESIKNKFKAIIFNKVNFGFGDVDGNDDIDPTVDLLKQSAMAEAIGDDSNNSNNNNNNNNNNNSNNSSTNIRKNKPYYVVNPPGIEDVRTLGEGWEDGIRSITFTTPKNDSGDYYQLKCLEEYPITYKDFNEKKEKKTLYTSNYCKNGDGRQQFYLRSYTDKNILTNDNEITDPKIHLHFHRHGYDEPHG